MKQTLELQLNGTCLPTQYAVQKNIEHHTGYSRCNNVITLPQSGKLAALEATAINIPTRTQSVTIFPPSRPHVLHDLTIQINADRILHSLATTALNTKRGIPD